ncbi:MAG TPA: hypothetical protein VF138_01515 [Caulobacteraceae bacterium]
MTRLHALIVEDHSTVALSLKSALSVMGFATFGFASTAAQTLAAARARKPDLVVASLAIHSGLEGEALEALAGAPVIYTAEPGAEFEGSELVLERPIGRAALSRALESLRAEAAAA